MTISAKKAQEMMHQAGYYGFANSVLRGLTEHQVREFIEKMDAVHEKYREPKVETYRLFASNGRYIRKATRVIFDDGKKIDFVELLPKHEAIHQARELRYAVEN